MEIYELNERIAQRLGRVSNGQPKYQWMRTESLFWNSQKQGWTARRLPSGIWVVGPEYRRRSFAELYGPCWSMAKWQPPGCSETTWHRRYIGALPYPAGGYYVPVGAMQLAPERTPDLDETLKAIWAILSDVERPFDELVEEGDRAMKDHHKEIDRKIEAEIDEILPDFIPGRGGSRSVFSEPLGQTA